MTRMLTALAVALLALLPWRDAEAQQVIKMATLVPEGSAWMRELRTAAREVQDGTKGRVQLKFYPGGVMGSDTVVLRKIHLGQLQGGVLASSDLAAIHPDAAVYSLPFLFSDWSQAERARRQVDPLLARGFEAKGLKMLAASNVGFAYLMSSKELRTRADITSARLWIPQSDEIAERTFRLGGVSPIMLPLGDVFTSLQTGLVDTVANTPSGTVALQWHGKMRTMVDLPVSFVVGYVVMDMKPWNKLAPPDQAVVAGAFRNAAKRLDGNVRRDDDAALAAMKKQGLKVTVMDPAETTRWRRIGDQVIRDMVADRRISAPMLAAVRKASAGQP